MFAAKKSKHIQLVDQLIELAKEKQINEIQLALKEQEARELQKNDLAWSSCILGIIECLRNNEKNSRRYHLTAINHSNNDPEIIYNFAVSLEGFGYLNEALNYALMAYDIEKDPLYIEFAIDRAYELGLSETVKRLIADWKKLTGKIHSLEDTELEKNAGVVREKVEQMLNRDLTDHKELWTKLADT